MLLLLFDVNKMCFSPCIQSGVARGRRLGLCPEPRWGSAPDPGGFAARANYWGFRPQTPAGAPPQNTPGAPAPRTLLNGVCAEPQWGLPRSETERSEGERSKAEDRSPRPPPSKLDSDKFGDEAARPNQRLD